MIKQRFSTLFHTGEWVLVFVIAFSLVIPGHIVFAESASVPSAQETEYTLADFDYRTDINFQGVLVEQTFNITLPLNWNFTSDATLTIRFSHSPILFEGSNMAVNWNGERMGSTLLTEDNAQRSELILSIPMEKINPGYNALQIEFYMGIQDDFCIDYDNPAVWAIVHNDTSLSMQHEVGAINLALSEVPSALMDNSLLSENAITLIVPPAPDGEHLDALAIFAAQLGRLADWRRSSLNLMTTEQALSEQPSGNLVLIATREEITAFDNGLASTMSAALSAYYNSESTHPDILTGDGMVSWQPSPFDERYHVLILSGETPAAVKKSAQGASFESLFAQSDGNWTLVRAVPKPQPLTDERAVSFASLGYENLTAYGTREQTLTFNLPLSSLWTIDSEAWLDLHFLHAKSLNGNRSTLSVLVNGIPVASIALNDRNAEEGYEEIRIPLRYLTVGDNTITLQANMAYTDNVSDFERFCTDDTYPRAWLTIESNSAVRFPDAPQQAPLRISQFPFGFANPYSYKGFAFTLPAAPEINTLKGLIQLAFSFGKSMLGNPAEIQVIQAAEDPAVYQDFNYIILFGAVNDILSPALNAELPIPVDLETGLLTENNITLQSDNTEGSLAYIEAFAYSEGTIMLLVTGNTPQALSNASTLLSQPGFRQSLDGSIAVVSSTENASAYKMQDSESVTLTQSQEVTIATPLEISSQSIWVLRVTAGTLGVSVIILLIALFRKNKRREESRGYDE